MAAFAFDGNITPAALGTPALKRVTTYSPVSYSSGENSISAINAAYSNFDFIETVETTVSASIRPNQTGTIIQHIVGDHRDQVTISLNTQNNIVASGNFQTITGPVVNLGEWHRVAISVSQSGNASIYLNENLIGNVYYRVTSLPTSRNSVVLYGGTNTNIDNLSVYSRALSAAEIGEVDRQ